MLTSNTDARVTVYLSLELWMLFKLVKMLKTGMDISDMDSLRPRDMEIQFTCEQCRVFDT